MISLISFTPAMLQQVQAGVKTQTRRLMRPQPSLEIIQGIPHYSWNASEHQDSLANWCNLKDFTIELAKLCPFGKPGDKLRILEDPNILLEIGGVRVERVQNITEADAHAEGIVKDHNPFNDDQPAHIGYSAGLDVSGGPLESSAIAVFRSLFTSIYPTAWAHNQWVWVVEFEQVKD